MMLVGNRVSEMKFQRALSLLEQVDKVKTKPKSGCEFYLKRGFVFFALNQYEASANDFAKATEILPKIEKYSDVEKRHLRAYAVYHLATMAESDLPSDLWEFDINQVGKELRRTFPLRHHPDWIEV